MDRIILMITIWNMSMIVMKDDILIYLSSNILVLELYGNSDIFMLEIDINRSMSRRTFN